MRIFWMTLMLSVSALLSACNEPDEQANIQEPPQPNCSMHCAP
ncbi:hypothetical protein [Acinetobacter tianfuensis]|nr:hypothetical protein [Acinetobacter tianfuensis]